MDINAILNDILKREGSAIVANDNGAGRSQYGITEKFHPEAWKDGHVDPDEAKAIYLKEYIHDPKFDQLPDPLAAQMVDFGVNSGQATAIKQLQTVLNLPTDGVIGPHTLESVRNFPDGPPALNNFVVAARVRYLSALITNHKVPASMATNLLNRAMSFLIHKA